MFTLPVSSFISYLTSVDGVVWRHSDYDANKMIKCLKGEAINGYLEIPIKGKTYTYREESRKELLELICGAVSKYLVRRSMSAYSIIPIPNSSAAVSSKDDFRTLQVSRIVAGYTQANVVPALRWKEAMLSSHKGGSRDPQALYNNLELVQVPSEPVILLDDVMTTGAHMIACCRKLMSAGVTPKHAIAIGRATRDQKASPVGWVEEVIEVNASESVWDIDF